MTSTIPVESNQIRGSTKIAPNSVDIFSSFSDENYEKNDALDAVMWNRKVAKKKRKQIIKPP